MSKRTRQAPEARREAVILAALDLAARVGYRHVTRTSAAEAAGVSASLVGHYLGDRCGLPRLLMREAVARGRVDIVAQGLALWEPAALAASPELRHAALASLGAKVL